MNTLQQTAVRVAVNTDFTVQASKKGITFGHSVITWEWLEKAKAAVFAQETAAVQPQKRKARATKKPTA